MKKMVLFFAAAAAALTLAGCPGAGEEGPALTEKGPVGAPPEVPAPPEVYIDPPTAPAPPVVIAGADRLVLFWTPAPGAESYEVWYGSSADRGAAAKLDDPVDVDTTAVITGLSGPCYVWVQAKNGGGAAWSAAVTAKPARVFDTGISNALNVDLPSYIRGAPGGGIDNPVPVAISGDLGETHYLKLLTMIKRAGKYVALDLSGVSGSGSGAGSGQAGILIPWFRRKPKANRGPPKSPPLSCRII
jgi:hypothetical protein